MTSNFRKDFPILKKKIQGKPLIYFDTAATAQKPQAVIDALSHFYTHHYGTVHRGVYTLAREATEAYNQTRHKVQKFLSARHVEEIIFTRGTTASLNLIARSFTQSYLKRGDVILLPEIEHHSNMVPWQMVAQERGFSIRFLPVNDQGEIDLDAFESLLDERVKLVTLAHLSNVIGTLHPVDYIIKKAHEAGAKVCLDGAQSAPHLPVNVEELDVDFYTFSGHKLYGPTGIGVLYGKKDLLENMPPLEGGGDMIERVTLAQTTYNCLPNKFEAGTPTLVEAIGLGEAIDYLSQIGMEKIYRWETELLNYACKKLSEIPGLRIIGTAKSKGAIISFVVEGAHPLDLALLLDCEGIAIRTGHHCCQPAMERFSITSTARISFGLYNTLEEIDRFITCLQNTLKALR
ncbi:MAG: cysteine desulfurase [Chlamydiales bacterium]